MAKYYEPTERQILQRKYAWHIAQIKNCLSRLRHIETEWNISIITNGPDGNVDYKIILALLNLKESYNLKRGNDLKRKNR